MRIYDEIKDMPNPSPGLLNFLKRRRTGRIWAFKPTFTGRRISKKQVKNLSLRELSLWLGSPSALLTTSKRFEKGIEKGEVASRSITGIDLKPKMFTGPSCNDVCLVGLGRRREGVWMIDVTERFIEEVTSIGACAVSEPHCKFELVSPRVKECSFCGRKLKRRVRTIKRVDWIDENKE